MHFFGTKQSSPTDPTFYYSTRDGAGKRRLESVPDIQSAPVYDPEKPTMIILPGIRVNEEVPAARHRVGAKVHLNSVGGMFKYLEQSLARSGNKDKANLFCFSYSKQDETPYLREFFPEPHMLQGDLAQHSSDAIYMVERVLLPFMGVTANDPKPDIEIACARLSKLTFFAHSTGSIFANEICNAFGEELIARGYTPDEVDRITNEVVTLSIANGAKLNRTKASWRTCSFGAHCDLTVLRSIERVGARYFGENLPIPASELYASVGYDPLIAENWRTNPGYVHRPRVRDPQPKITPTSHGVALIGELPGELDLPGGKLDRAALTEIYSRSAKLLKHPIGVMGEPLFLDDIELQHWPHSFMVPTLSGNNGMVMHVDTAAANALNRSMAEPHHAQDMHARRASMMAMVTQRPPALQAAYGMAA